MRIKFLNYSQLKKKLPEEFWKYLDEIVKWTNYIYDVDIYLPVIFSAERKITDDGKIILGEYDHSEYTFKDSVVRIFVNNIQDITPPEDIWKEILDTVAHEIAHAIAANDPFFNELDEKNGVHGVHHRMIMNKIMPIELL